MSSRFRSLRLEPLEDRALLSATAASSEGANLSLVENGLPGFLSSLQERLNEVVFVAPAPLVGNQLSYDDPTSEDPGQFMTETVADKLGDSWLTSGSGTPVTIKDIVDALNEKLDSLIEGDIIPIGKNNDAEIQFQLTLVGTMDGKPDVDLAQGDDPIIEALLGIQNTVDVTTDWTYDLTFGVNASDGFFVNTATAEELEVFVTATLQDDLAAKGKVGVFGALIEADGPSTFSGTYSIDVSDADGDSNLFATEYAGLGVNAHLTGSGTVNLDVDAAFIPDFADDINRKGLFNLVVTADAKLDYQFNKANTQLGHFGDPVIVEFDNVNLNLGKFFTEFVDPTVKKIQDTLRPLKPVVDFLTDPVPVISDLSGDDVSVLDLAISVLEPSQRELVKELEKDKGKDNDKDKDDGRVAKKATAAVALAKARTVVNFIDAFLDIKTPIIENLQGTSDLGSFTAEVTVDLDPSEPDEDEKKNELVSSKKSQDAHKEAEDLGASSK